MTVEMHWVLTLSWNNADGTRQDTWEGVLDELPATRQEAFRMILDFVKETHPIPDAAPASVVFFSLEPNTLTEGSKP